MTTAQLGGLFGGFAFISFAGIASEFTYRADNSLDVHNTGYLSEYSLPKGIAFGALLLGTLGLLFASVVGFYFFCRDPSNVSRRPRLTMVAICMAGLMAIPIIVIDVVQEVKFAKFIKDGLQESGLADYQIAGYGKDLDILQVRIILMFGLHSILLLSILIFGFLLYRDQVGNSAEPSLPIKLGAIVTITLANALFIIGLIMNTNIERYGKWRAISVWMLLVGVFGLLNVLLGLAHVPLVASGSPPPKVLVYVLIGVSCLTILMYLVGILVGVGMGTYHLYVGGHVTLEYVLLTHIPALFAQTLVIKTITSTNSTSNSNPFQVEENENIVIAVATAVDYDKA